MADVSILNTTSGLSGKTVVLAESAATITGLHTFDLDPSAPFAVTSGSAKVTNLDADKLDGQDWTSPTIVTPTITTPTITTPTISAPTITGIITASGGQIAFPATQSASADANTLDDYEEGTWTPSLGGSATYTAQSGTYTKIGRQVSIQGHLTVNAIGTGSTGVISGLPFNTAATCAGTVCFFSASATNYTCVSAFIVSNTVQFTATAAAVSAMTNPAVLFGAGTDVYFAATYFV